MTHQDLAQPSPHASSTSQAYTGADWLDAHFETNRPEYEAMLRSVPFEPGWHVLDAGCGSGGFLPLIAEMVGPSGQLTALDLAPDNVALVQGRLDTWNLLIPVRVQVGTVADLPFPVDSFDAVWCANTTQYLSDADLASALQEFRRVVRPGGLVAIKDVDAITNRGEPSPAFFSAHRTEAIWTASPQPGFSSPGTYRGPALRSWLRAAGYAEVWVRTTVIERWAPLRPVEQAFFRDVYRAFARQALQLDLPAEDLALWRELNDPAGAEAYVAHPDFYVREGNVVAVGRVV